MRRSVMCGLVAAATVALLSAACAKKPEAEPATGGRDFRESAPPSGTSTQPAPGLSTVYFDYDRSEVRSDAGSALKENARVIGEKDWDQVILEGHCDERGSEEYNLALGERRANAVRRYLMSLGVPGPRLTTVSYGESRAAKPGHDESAWRYNRRVDFAIRK